MKSRCLMFGEPRGRKGESSTDEEEIGAGAAGAIAATAVVDLPSNVETPEGCFCEKSPCEPRERLLREPLGPLCERIDEERHAFVLRSGQTNQSPAEDKLTVYT